MKRSQLILAIGLLFTIQAQAQFQNLTVGSNVFTLSSVNMKTGMESDVYRNMSPDWMKDHTKNPDDIAFDASGFETTSHAHVSSFSLGGHVAFTSPRAPKGRKQKAKELRFGVDAQLGGEALVTFTDSDEGIDSTYTRSLMYCLVEHEMRVSSEYRCKTSWGRFNTFIGVGAQLGGTMNSEMLVFNTSSVTANSETEEPEWLMPDMETMEVETYEAKSSLYMRAYVPFGMSVRVCDRMELGMEHRLGVGVEQVLGGDTNFMKHTGLTYFTVGYHFDKYQKRSKKDFPDYR